MPRKKNPLPSPRFRAAVAEKGKDETPCGPSSEAESWRMAAGGGGVGLVSAEDCARAAEELTSGVHIVQRHLPMLEMLPGQRPAALPALRGYAASVHHTGRDKRALTEAVYEYVKYLNRIRIPAVSGSAIADLSIASGLYFSTLSAGTLYKRTFEHKIGAIRSLFRHLYETEQVPFLYLPKYLFRLTEQQAVALSEQKTELRRNLPSEQDMRAVLDRVLADNRLSLYACLRMMWHFGLRKSEVVQITRRSFGKDENGRWVFLRYGKAERVACAPKEYMMPATLMRDIEKAFKAIDCWEAPLAPLAYNEKTPRIPGVTPDFRIGRRMREIELAFLIRWYFRRVCEKRVNTHDIRRGRATSMRRGGVPESDICRALNMSLQTLRNHYDRSISETEDLIGSMIDDGKAK